MIRLVIDLEVENTGKHSGKIIQLGYCIFNARTKQMIHTDGDYIKRSPPYDFKLSREITSLTGISDREIEQRGVSLLDAYVKMVTLFNKACLQEREDCLDPKHKEKDPSYFGFYKIIEWGFGDAEYLRKQILEEFPSLTRSDFSDNDLLFYSGHKKLNPDLNNNTNFWHFGQKTMDVKASCQAYMIANNLRIGGGLKKSCKNLKVGFTPYIDDLGNGHSKQRGSHDARADSLNTVRIYLKIF